MANTYTKIAQATIGTPATNIDILNIPQGYTDIIIHLSGRTDHSGSIGNLAMWFNNDGNSNYGVTSFTGTGTSNSSSRTSTGFPVGIGNINSAGTFSNLYTTTTIYIPNYSNTSYFKQIQVETTTENNTTTAYSTVSSFVYRSTNAITVIALNGNQVTQGFLAPTTMTMYGIKNS